MVGKEARQLESSQSLPLIEAVGKYIGTLGSKGDQEELFRELTRFTNWCGPQRQVDDLTPPEIGVYAEEVGGTGTSPRAAERLQTVRDFLRYARKQGFTDVNLSSHVRSRKPRSRARGVQVRDAKKMVELTPEGHQSLTEELDRLKGERGPLAVQIRRAAADKDVRENAPLEAAREQLGMVESRIATIEETLKDAVIIEAGTQTEGLRVRLGARVSMKDLDSGDGVQLHGGQPVGGEPPGWEDIRRLALGEGLHGPLRGAGGGGADPQGKTRLRILAISV